MKFPVLPGSLLSAATLVAASCFLAGALSSATLPATPAHRLATPVAAQSEIEACERAGVRSHAACVGEAEGKALIRHAEWIAALEESGRDVAHPGAGSVPGVIVVHPARAISQ